MNVNLYGCIQEPLLLNMQPKRLANANPTTDCHISNQKPSDPEHPHVLD